MYVKETYPSVPIPTTSRSLLLLLPASAIATTFRPRAAPKGHEVEAAA